MSNLKIIKQEDNIVYCHTAPRANFDNTCNDALLFVKEAQTLTVQYAELEKKRKCLKIFLLSEIKNYQKILIKNMAYN